MPTGIEWTDETWNPVVAGARQWKEIPGFPGYCANADGQILSLRRSAPRVLKPITDARSGHQYVFLYREHRGVKTWVHAAVLLAFVGLPTPGHECRHLDGNPSNNRRANLAWGSPLQNSEDKRRHGTMAIGERSGTHKLTEADVLAIRVERNGASLRELGTRYGVSHTAIRRAATGAKWAHLTEGIRP